MMKIAFDYQTFMHQTYGGISRYYSILANELIKRKEEVKVFAGLHQNNYLLDLPLSSVSGCKLKGYPPKSKKIFHSINYIFNQFQFRNWKPDIIHETYYTSLPNLSSGAYPVITTAYDMIHEIYPEMFSKKDKTSVAKGKTFDRVDHIISISESTKLDMIKLFGVDESKISVVHLGVSLEDFVSLGNQDTYLEGKPYLLYVGSRFGYKNFDGFLKAIASSQSLCASFDVIAFGGGNFNYEELSLIHSLGFSENQVKHVGGNDEVLAELYRHAAAFVYPSLYEGFGLPPLEAMASGCPVVSSNTSSMPEVVRDAGAYFQPNEIEDMRFAIERVVFSSTVRADLVQKGHENIKHFTWQSCAEETLAVYKKVLGKS